MCESSRISHNYGICILDTKTQREIIINAVRLKLCKIQASRSDESLNKAKFFTSKQSPDAMCPKLLLIYCCFPLPCTSAAEGHTL